MEIFDIIQTLADLSNKGSEFNEEIGELNLKVSTLQNALMKLEKGRALDPLQIKHMRDLLSEAVTLMQNVSKQTNLWRNIRNMFPGSELSQIKEINTKIEKAIQLVNLSINTHACRFNAAGTLNNLRRIIDLPDRDGRSISVGELQSVERFCAILCILPIIKCAGCEFQALEISNNLKFLADLILGKWCQTVTAKLKAHKAGGGICGCPWLLERHDIDGVVIL